jgi:hypothetical protein
LNPPTTLKPGQRPSAESSQQKVSGHPGAVQSPDIPGRFIGLSKHLRGTKVIVLINDLDIRVLERDSGKLIRKLTLDPTRDYQPRGVKPGNSPTNRPQM